MREWIDLLNEMPISSIETPGIDDDDSYSFSATDRALLSNPKARAKIIRAFAKTPFDFEVIFLFNNRMDGDDDRDNNDVDLHAKKVNAGVHNQYAIGGYSIKGKPGVIRILMLSNLSPVEQKMPMNAWTLAHKIGHAIQDSFTLAAYSRPSKLEWAQWTYLINQLINDISSIEEGGGIYPSTNYEYPAWMSEYLTMKSARDEKLTNGFELYAELIAQYLIAGRITMKLKNPAAQKIVGDLNDAVYELLSSVVGKVLVEV